MEGVFGLVFGIILATAIILGVINPDKVWQKQAVEHQCAEYNSTTGEFQWKFDKLKTPE